MFYCDPCRAKRSWPDSPFKSHGKCEICGAIRSCNDVQSKYLPAPLPPEPVEVDPFVKSEAVAMAEELENIVERLEEIGDSWAVDSGFKAVSDKIEESLGRLNSAAEAARQYASGVLAPKEDW